MDVTEFKDYRTALDFWINGQRRLGIRTRLAQAIGCSPSWLTRVLAGEAHLTPDQGLGVTEYFGLSETDTEYFLLLLDMERASSERLRRRLGAKQKMLLEARRNLRTAMRSTAIAEPDRVKYYSSWLHAAVHVACMIQEFTAEELAIRLMSDNRRVTTALASLNQMGLVETREGRWRATSKSIHLDAEDPIATLAHAIWRNRTVQYLQEEPSKGLHYSAVHCLSRKDVELLRKKLRDHVIECRKIIEPSPSETLAVFCLDWYEL